MLPLDYINSEASRVFGCEILIPVLVLPRYVFGVGDVAVLRTASLNGVAMTGGLTVTDDGDETGIGAMTLDGVET